MDTVEVNIANQPIPPCRRGRILRDTNVGPGLLTVEGTQYPFLLEGMWRSEVPPRAGMWVDVTFDGKGVLAGVYAVSEAQLAKEQAHKALSGALRQGGALGGGLKGHFGTLTAAAELILLLSFFLVPNMRIGSAYSERAISGWDAIGLNPVTAMTNDHGLLSLLAILCLLAPLAASFLKQAWSHWLYAAPFGFAVLAFITLTAQIHSASQAASAAVGEAFGSATAREMSAHISGMFSTAPGAWVVLLCSLVLAWRVVRKTA